MEYVILVDESGTPNGTAEKLVAHQSPGLLHLAFSVFVFDREGKVLLQRRADQKHHFRSRWSNTCCSHPRPGEGTAAAGRRRLMEEMGIDLDLQVVGRFTYRAEDPESGLVEHEVDDVLTGVHEGEPTPNPTEVSAWRWADIERIGNDMVDQPDEYTPWLLPALQVVKGLRP